MDTDKALGIATFIGVLAGIGGLVYFPHGPRPDADPFKADCEKKRDCTYKVESPKPGTTSTVYAIDGLRFTIPDEFFFDRGRFSPKPAWLGSMIVAHLPDLAPLTLEDRSFEYSSDSPNYSKEITITFKKNPRHPHAVHVQELEDEIVALRHAPRPVPGIPSLQEYAIQGKRSYFRATDNRIRYYDGLPTYFVCYGDSVIFGYDPIANPKKARCNMGMTWPNGFEVDILFSESLLPQWNTILGAAVGLLKSFEDQHRLPSGTLALD